MTPLTCSSRTGKSNLWWEKNQHSGCPEEEGEDRGKDQQGMGLRNFPVWQ